MSLLGKVARGFPALFGVLWGLILYQKGIYRGWIVFLVFGIAWGSLSLGKKIIGKHPRAGRFFIEFWVGSAVCAVALSTALIIWLTVKAPTFFVLPADELKAVTGALIGAITTYLAIIWTDDIKEAGGPLWPSTQFKNALSFAFRSGPYKPTGDTREYEAAFTNIGHKGGPSGWGFRARGQRARILSEHVKEIDRASKPT